MLAPFHYFGIHDLEIDDETVENTALFGRLTSDERVRHITEKIEEYSVTKKQPQGLNFLQSKRRGQRTVAQIQRSRISNGCD